MAYPDAKRWAANYCPLHGNRHQKHRLEKELRLSASISGGNIVQTTTYHCSACGRDFDENLIPLKPPPSKAMWNRKMEKLWPKFDFEHHDRLSDALYMSFKKEKT